MYLYNCVHGGCECEPCISWPVLLVCANAVAELRALH